MWLLNKKTIILELPKLTYKCWEEIKWVIRFDFWEEKVKADKITIWLNRKITTTWLDLSDWVKVNNRRRYNFLLETNLSGKWEYSKEEIPFNFIVPNNAVANDISFEKILNKIPKAFRTIAEILVDMLIPNMRKKYSFEVIARLDIPWGIDITERVAININSDLVENKIHATKKEENEESEFIID